MIPERERLEGDEITVTAQLERLSQHAPSYEYRLNEQLHRLAVKLAANSHLTVYVVTYENGSQELEVGLADGSTRDPVTISRDNTGTECQVSYEPWMNIGSTEEVTRVADVINLLVRVSNPGKTKAPTRVHDAGTARKP